MRILNTKSNSSKASVTYNESKLDQTLEDGSIAAKRLLTNIRTGGESFSSIQTELNARAKINSRAKNKFIHLKIAFHAEDNPSDLTMSSIALKTLKQLGLSDTPYVVYRHYDREHPHLHIVATRVKKNGLVASDSFDGLRQRELARRFEQEFGLVRAEDQRVVDGVRLEGYLEAKQKETSREMHPNQYIREAFMSSVDGTPTLPVFIKRMRRRGVDVYFKPFRTLSGISKVGVSYRLIGSDEEKGFRVESEFPLASYPTLPRVQGFSYRALAGVELHSGRWPNGIPCIHPSGINPPADFRAWSVRASKLGPLFQYDSINGLVSGATLENLPVRSNNFSRHNFRHRNMPTPFAEPSAHRKMMVCLESKNTQGAIEAILEGASTDRIAKDDLRFLDPVTVAEVSRARKEIDKDQPASPTNISEYYRQRHLAEYQFVNPNTIRFFEAMGNGDVPEMSRLLKVDSKPNTCVDTRSILSDDSLSGQILDLVTSRALTLNNLESRNSYLLTRKELVRKQIRDLFDAAIEKKDHFLLRRALGSSESMDVIYYHTRVMDTLPDASWIRDKKMSAAIKIVLKAANDSRGDRGESQSLSNTTNFEHDNRSGMGI
jgi:hypothetical protein